MNSVIASNLDQLLSQARACTRCKNYFDHDPRPVLRAAATAQILIIGQAPGTKVHASGIPWDDASGRRLRQWMAVDDKQFYDESQIAIIPMGLCYPGKGKSGDLPPRPECAPLWHPALMQHLPQVQCTLLIGQYAQKHYLPGSFTTLTERVQNWRNHTPDYYLLPHPSPRNQMWLRRNDWFERDVVPHLQNTITNLLR